jgi:TolB protein
MRTLKIFILIQFITFGIAQADNQIYIDVGHANLKKSLLALPSFLYFGSQEDQENIRVGQELFGVIHNDLTVSSLFTFIAPAAYLEDPNKLGLKPKGESGTGFDFRNWASIGTDFLIRGGYRVSGGKVSLEIYLYYVPQAKLVFAKTYESPIVALRKVGHTFANDVVKSLTGKPGIFLTKFVASRDLGVRSAKEIYMMDWDGQNVKAVTNHRGLALSPAWSPDAKKIAYTNYAYHPHLRSRNADLFLFDLALSKRWLVSYRKGINSGANFFPDGESLLLTISQNGNPDIYRMDTDGKNISQLTHGPHGAMNVEPALSADAKEIAFSSDRSGQPMIYVMSVKGASPERLTFAGKYNASPSWSPDGKKIAFAGQDKSHFDIFVMDRNGTGMERLTDAKKKNGQPANNEDPSYSPDGRHVVFSSDRSGNYQLYIINVDGTGERRITLDSANYTRPKWSPIPND